MAKPRWTTDRQIRFLKLLIPGGRPLAEALSEAGITLGEFAALLADDAFMRLAEEKIESYTRFCYLATCAKLARIMLADPAHARASLLKFIAERFDPKYMPTTQVLHAHRSLPEFEHMSHTELLQFIEDKTPEWLLNREGREEASEVVIRNGGRNGGHQR